MGYNVNVAWTGGVDPPIGDVEYLTAFRWGLRRAEGGVGTPGPCRGWGRKHSVPRGWRGSALSGAEPGEAWPSHLPGSAWALPLQDSGDAHCPRVLT